MPCSQEIPVAKRQWKEMIVIGKNVWRLDIEVGQNAVLIDKSQFELFSRMICMWKESHEKKLKAEAVVPAIKYRDMSVMV